MTPTAFMQQPAWLLQGHAQGGGTLRLDGTYLAGEGLPDSGAA